MKKALIFSVVTVLFVGLAVLVALSPVGSFFSYLTNQLFLAPEVKSAFIFSAGVVIIILVSLLPIVLPIVLRKNS